MKFELTETMSKIVAEVQRIGKVVYVVGGAVRDNLMDKKPKDLDFATNYDHLALTALIRRMGLVVIPDKTAEAHGIIRVVDRDTGELIDIARLRRDDTTDGRHATVTFTDILEEDLARRDLTINAMAAQVNPDGSVHNFIDPFEGVADIKEKIIKFVGQTAVRIQEDYLRMIRACRFTALGEGWTLDPIAIRDMIGFGHEINTISKERICDEITKALGYDKPSAFFRALDTTGLLPRIFPDLAQGVGCEQNEYHAEPVFDHLLRCLDASVGLTDNVYLRLAALTHDVAKPHTKSTDIGGSVHFYRHEVVGADIMYRWMRDYRFPKKEAEYVSKLVRHHQWRFDTKEGHHYACKICKLAIHPLEKKCTSCPDGKAVEHTCGCSPEDNCKCNGTSDKTIRRWLQAVGPEWRDLIILRQADRRGNLKKADRPMITGKMYELINRAENIIARGDPIFKEDLAINGNDLKLLGIPPGKVYKDIFVNMLGIVMTNPEKNNKEWLEQYARKNYLTRRN